MKRIPGITWPYELIISGNGKFLMKEVWTRFYKEYYEQKFALKYKLFRRLPSRVIDFNIQLETNNPIAYESPDHLNPYGTARDNSTNKKFVEYMADLIKSEYPHNYLGALDLGCSGGQLVKDFKDLGWMAVGLEGSDFSLKHKRANWAQLANTNLFTCDITKPFQITSHKSPAKFNLITMWEVLEHIHTNDLPQLFKNITAHMAYGGYFVASTTSTPDIHNGVDLHQTKWIKEQWVHWLACNFPQFKLVEFKLKSYQYVRHNIENSILTFKKT